MPSLPARRTPALDRHPARAWTPALLALLLLGLAAPAARSQGSFVYALTEKGNLSANATLLDKLPAKYNASDPNSFGQVWWDLLVDGPDRYALRLDGRIQKNGELYQQLLYTTVFEGSWLRLAMANGQLWAMRNDGNLARDGIVVVDLPREDFFFQSLVARGNDVFTLRSDGAVFKNIELSPTLQFVGGPGVVSGAEEGADVDTVWRAMVLDPLDMELYAIRNDGKVVRGDPDAEGSPSGGTLLAALPFDPNLDTSSQAAVLSALYADMTFLDDGSWIALNGGGEIYEEGSHVEPLVDLPGGPFGGQAQLYNKVFGGMNFLTLRADGQIYLGTEMEPLVDLPKTQFRAIASSDVAPDLTSFKNSRPIVTRTKAVALEGQDISVPVLATDVEKSEADLMVTVDLTKMPAGATWNDATRMLDWPNPGPVGKYRFIVTVDDGQTKPVVSKNSIVVKPLDANTAKNRKPLTAKVKKTQALVGVPLILPILATDLDDDVLTLSVDETQSPFTEGATFNPETRIFRWTPGLEHLGTHQVVFFVSDGTVTRKAKLKMTVISSLIGI